MAAGGLECDAMRSLLGSVGAQRLSGASIGSNALAVRVLRALQLGRASHAAPSGKRGHPQSLFSSATSSSTSSSRAAERNPTWLACVASRHASLSTTLSGSPGTMEGAPAAAEGMVVMSRSRRDYRLVSDNMVEDVLESLIPLLDDKQRTPDHINKSIAVLQCLLMLWISKKNLLDMVKRYPRVLQLNTSEMSKRINYFMERGCTPGEVGAAVVRDPNWLSASMDNIEKTAAYLVSTGISSEKVPKVLLKSPAIMELDPNQDMQPLINCLGDLVPVVGGVERMIERQPMVLELADADVADRTAVMASFGLKPEQISSLIFYKPSVLLMPPDVLAARFMNLRKIFSPRRLPNIFKTAPGILCASPERINRQYELFQDYLTPDIAEKVVNAFPQALSLNWEKVLLPKLDYLERLGLQPSEVVNFPAYLGYSLPDRIKPRCEVLLKAGFTIAPHAQVISSDSERKLRKFGRSHREILEQEGSHAVCIQHIVGLREEEFRAQFGVGLATLPRSRLRETDLDESDLDELEDLADDMDEKESDGRFGG